jgi:molecular chaperone DnaK
LKEILEEGSKDDIEVKTKDLSETLSQIGQSMYGDNSQTASAGEQTQENGEQKPEDEKASDEKAKAEEGEVVS